MRALTAVRPGYDQGGFFDGQVGHLAAVLVLLAGVYLALDIPGATQGRFLSVTSLTWLVVAVADTIAHQVYVWLCWRAELYRKSLSRRFGERAFTLYAAGFTVLFVARAVFAFALGYANRGTLPIAPWLGYLIALLLVPPAGYLFYSVKAYFTFRRAFGIDHFEPQAFKDAPLVRGGIFRFSPNAMYVFGFFTLWIPAFLFQSAAALIFAAFSHVYIWVHYFCTEKPDMRRIYGP